MFLFDAGSRYVLNKQLSNTVNFIRSLRKDYKIYEMLRYHVIGYNSRPNYPPILFGKEYDSYKSEHISIFQEYNKEGYITIDLEMAGDYGERFYLKSVKNITSFDHSLHILSYQKEYMNRRYSSKSRCLGKKQIHQYGFEYIKKASQYYHKQNQPFFIFQSFMDSHDGSFSSTPRLDNDIVDLFSYLHNNTIMEDTIIILCSDHGMHYGRYYKTKFGRIDHKLPLLSFV